ncbi:MAG: DUF983 domain-containing protein [Actinomycetota bacterium]
MRPDTQGAIDTSDPYGLLDPGENAPGGSPPAITEAGTFVVLFRGLRKRCPRCGERRIWNDRFHLKPICPVCSLRFEQEEGGFLGAMVINYAVAIGVWLVVLVVTLIVTVPEVPVPSLLVMSVAALVGTPLWFYPRSKTLWAAIEFLVRRSQPDYRTPTAPDPRARDLE